MSTFNGGRGGPAGPRRDTRDSRDTRGDSRGGRGPRAGRPIDDPARMTAYQALLAVHRDDAYANLVLPGLIREAGLDSRDAAFTTELTYGTLRSRGSLDAVIEKAAGREMSRIDPPTRDALRLGAYQLLHTRVPTHAATMATVELVRAVAPGATGFANAVLRKIGERDLKGWLDEIAPRHADDPIANLAITHNHPEWIVRAFREALGGDLAETAELLAANNERPEVHLCARPGRADAVELAESADGRPGAFSPYAVYLNSGAPGDLPEIRDGRAHVQDEGSQLVAIALADAPVSGRDERWLDLCAGPGGKAGLLACLAAGRGAHLTAVEVTEHRAKLVSQAVSGMPATVLCADGRSVGVDRDLPEEGFDRVLVDAPCTGLGSLRRRPESRWRRQPTDLAPLTKLQRELLAAALKAARPGGLVAYVTCSPHLVETRVSVGDAIRRSGIPAELIDARPYLPGVPDLGDGPHVQLWPHRHGTDAMFLSLIRRLPADPSGR